VNPFPEGNMAEPSRGFVVEQLIAVLNEAFDGGGTYFTDAGPDAGLVGTLAKLTAEEASREIGGNTIAGQAHHILFGLGASARWVRGDRGPNNWAESWTVRTVDDAAWSRLRENLRAAHDELRRAVEANATSGEEAFGGVAGAIAHAAYHLGAIRQKVALNRRT
jgi:hypothetical protein